MKNDWISNYHLLAVVFIVDITRDKLWGFHKKGQSYETPYIPMYSKTSYTVEILSIEVKK